MNTKEVRRFPSYFVWVHGIVLASFTICILTGLPLKFEWWGVANFFGGHAVTKWIHRISGVVLCVDAFGFAFWALSKELAGGFKGGLWFRWGDVAEAFAHLGYMLGGRKEKPQFNHFSYLHKMEFWAGGIGIFLMTISGFLLWFPRSFGGLVIESAWVIHSWEAVLALVAIYIWHIFHVHTLHGSPRVNQVWLTGMIPVDELKHEFPGEYNELVEKGEIKVTE